MADNKINNYTLIELLHLSYLIRDSLEYCHAQINVTEENFERRKEMAKKMLAEGNFVEKWLNGHPNDDVKALYPQLVNYFKNIYEVESFVNFDTRKVDPKRLLISLKKQLKTTKLLKIS